MIVRHKYLFAPPDDTVIWRYMPMPYFFYLLNQSKLYFSRVDNLEDKAEVLVSEKEKTFWKDILKDDIDKWVDFERKRVFVNCWIKSNTENSLMWSAYAEQGTGVAIKTSVSRLMKSYNGPECISILDVNYIDHKNQSVQSGDMPINVLRFFSTKRIVYQSEQELRLVFESKKSNDFHSFTIPIDINTLIEEVRIGPNVSQDMIDVIKIFIKAKGYTFKMMSSELFYH